DDRLQTVNAYDPWMGRFITGEEVRHRAQSVVLGREIRQALFTGGDFIGKTIHINRVPFRVIGELEPKGRSLFFSPAESITIPYPTLEKYFPPADDAPFFVPRRGEYFLNAVAVAPERTAAAVDQIEEVLRRRRHVPARGQDNFSVFTEEALSDLYDQLTRV